MGGGWGGGECGRREQGRRGGWGVGETVEVGGGGVVSCGVVLSVVLCYVIVIRC